MTAALRRSVESLGVPNYRRYFTGQAISLTGTWMQTVAEAWLVLRLTGSGFALGLATALQFLPLLVAGAWGGLLADRVPKRRLLSLTQSLMAVPALTLWALSATGAVRLWMVFALIFTRGAINAVDNPARQSFVSEMVGPERVLNAVSLNSVLVQTARVTGPALAAVVIATLGVSACFGLNALSFGCFIFALRRMDPGEMHPAPVARRGRGQLRSALAVVVHTPALARPLILMAVVGTLSFNFNVILPVLARFTFHGGASTYAVLTAGMGVGAVSGALANGARGAATPRLVAAAALLFAVAMGATAAAPSLAVAIVALAAVGAASVSFSASINAMLQLQAPPEIRGRVLALYSIVFLGSTPVGGPLLGWVSEALGPRTGLAIGAIAALGAGLLARWWIRGQAHAAPPAGAGAPSAVPAPSAPARRPEKRAGLAAGSRPRWPRRSPARAGAQERW